MPKLDGTGPSGKGPRTGRGRGICGGGIGNIAKKKSLVMRLISIAVPAVTAVVTDARKPDGITRRLYSVIKGRLTGTSHERVLTDSQENYIENACNNEIPGDENG